MVLILSFSVLKLQRIDGYLKKVETKKVDGEKKPQKYINKPVAVPTWPEFVEYLLSVDKLKYVSLVLEF